jgi:hypothetical protein
MISEWRGRLSRLTLIGLDSITIDVLLLMKLFHGLRSLQGDALFLELL